MTQRTMLLYAIAALFFCTIEAQAQVSIGSDIAPIEGALLDLKEHLDGSSGKGLMMPRVYLESPTSLQPIISKSASDYEKQKDLHKGLTVYNLNQTDRLAIGEYYWDGNRWLKKIVVESLGEESQVLMSDGKGNAIWSKIEMPTFEHFKITDMVFYNKLDAADKTYAFGDIVNYTITEGVGKISLPRAGIFNNPIYSTKFTVRSSKSNKYAFIIADANFNFQTINNIVVGEGYWVAYALQVYVDGVLRNEHLQTNSIPTGGSSKIHISKTTILNLNDLEPGEHTLDFKWGVTRSTLHANIDPGYPYNMTPGYFNPYETQFCKVKFTDIAFQLFEM